jgi:hypothetical protein
MMSGGREGCFFEPSADSFAVGRRQKGTGTGDSSKNSYRRHTWNNCTRNQVPVSTAHGHYGMVDGLATSRLTIERKSFHSTSTLTAEWELVLFNFLQFIIEDRFLCPRLMKNSDDKLTVEMATYL